MWTFVVLAFAILPRLLASGEALTDVRTAHCLLHVEGMDPQETGRFLDAAYTEMKRFFSDVEPDRKIQIKIYATRERYQSEMDRLRKIFAIPRRCRDAAGMYIRETACSYLYIQPQEYSTRRTLLHEFAHAYHDFIRPWSRVPSLEFCEEGIAEYFALHNWDGQRLKLGIVPVIASVDYPRMALRQLQNTARFDLESIVVGDTEVDYPLAWGLASFLINCHRAKFNIWRQGLNNGVEPRVVWQKQFGPITPELRRSFESWLQSNAPPWQVISGDWSPWAELIEGKAGENEFAVAILNETPRRWTVTLEPSRSAPGAGVVIGFHGARNYHIVQPGSDGVWEIAHCTGPTSPKERQTFSASKNLNKVTVEPGEGFTTIRVGEQSVALTNVSGRVGLWVQQGRHRFGTTTKPISGEHQVTLRALP
jgi:hypothetical protein